jgi:hypothetical protein
MVESATGITASAFLEARVAAVPDHTLLTDNAIQFRFALRDTDGTTARYTIYRP